MSKQEVQYGPLANAVMFAGRLSLSDYGVQYRKGKTIEDVRKAVAKARKFGRCKVECELSLLEVYLKEIFKAA